MAGLDWPARAFGSLQIDMSCTCSRKRPPRPLSGKVSIGDRIRTRLLVEYLPTPPKTTPATTSGEPVMDEPWSAPPMSVETWLLVGNVEAGVEVSTMELAVV